MIALAGISHCSSDGEPLIVCFFALLSGSAAESVLYSRHSVTVAGQSEYGKFFFNFSPIPLLGCRTLRPVAPQGGSVC